MIISDIITGWKRSQVLVQMTTENVKLQQHENDGVEQFVCTQYQIEEKQHDGSSANLSNPYAQVHPFSFKKDMTALLQDYLTHVRPK